MLDFTNERWLPVVGWEGFYEVSDCVRVRSVRRPGVPKTGRIRKLGLIEGYPALDLWCQGVRTSCYVHQLVAAAFLGPCPPDEEVRHLDGDRLNGVPSNLAYGTRAENVHDAVGHGTHFQARKTHCPQNHEYTPENTKVIPSRPTARYCRECHRIRSVEARRQKAARKSQAA